MQVILHLLAFYLPPVRQITCCLTEASPLYAQTVMKTNKREIWPEVFTSAVGSLDLQETTCHDSFMFRQTQEVTLTEGGLVYRHHSVLVEVQEVMLLQRLQSQSITTGMLSNPAAACWGKKQVESQRLGRPRLQKLRVLFEKLQFSPCDADEQLLQ